MSGFSDAALTVMSEKRDESGILAHMCLDQRSQIRKLHAKITELEINLANAERSVRDMMIEIARRNRRIAELETL